MRSSLGLFIFLALMLLMDFYVFLAVKSITNNSSEKTKMVVYSIYWCLTVLSIIGILVFVYASPSLLSKPVRTYIFSTIIGVFLSKILVVFFLIADDVRRMIQWLIQKLVMNANATSLDKAASNAEEVISRSVFMSWLGIAAGGTLFGSLISGFSNKYKYTVIKQQLRFPNLPASFKGLKILHISDIHSGSFLDKHAVQKGVDLILQQQADLILFTGDLVNDRAEEMNEYKALFSSLKAPLGVYSTLGNHDYGDYVQWPYNGISKEENLNLLKKVHVDMGWKLLMNEHVILERGNDTIALLGIENWSSKARFPKHGRLDLAHAGTENQPFKILMSHDPSHWHAQVLPEYEYIDLTLSGHTHGMQFGVELPGFKWSPVQYVYKEWAGLYESGKNKLYVNRGFGFIGYPGRVGVLPEITVLELV